MASKDQIQANRLNAKKSTGPKTFSGKSRASRNSLRHGLTARRVALWYIDDPREWAQLRHDLIAHLKPVGILEELLVDEMLKALLDIWHVDKLQAAILSEGTIAEFANRALISSKATAHGASDRLNHLNQALDQIDNGENSEETCVATNVKQSKSARLEFSQLPRKFIENFVSNTGSLDLINRYHARGVARFYRALEELQSIQDQRG
jgi:hypothetical protein